LTAPRREHSVTAVLGLNGKVALVTGASKGIGRACAAMLARAGADVAVHYFTDEKGAHSCAELVTRAGTDRPRRACVVRADLRIFDSGEALVREVVERLGRLDCVVLSHGIWSEAPIDALDQRALDEMLDTNLRGVFSVCGAAVRHMKETRTRGRIVTIASTAAQRGEALHAHYAASKGAVVSLTKSLATELAPAGILVNCVAPGWVRTPMTAQALTDDVAHRAIAQTIPLGRVGEPDEIAGPVTFLCSDLAMFMTGEILNVNGGAVLCG